MTFSYTMQLQHPHYDLKIHLLQKLKHLENFVRFLFANV